VSPEDRIISRIHSNMYQTVLVFGLICSSFFVANIALAAPADDFIIEIKRQLPKHLQFDSLEMKNIEEKGNSAFSVMKADLLIKVRAKENLYRMKSYKNGKYELVITVKKGAISERVAVGMTLPPMAGMGKIKVMMLPDNNASADPLSKYKKGTYTIVAADSKTPAETNKTTKAAVIAPASVSSAAVAKPIRQPVTSVLNNNIALVHIMDIYKAQGAVYGTLPASQKHAPIILKNIKKNSDGSLSGHAEYPTVGSIHPFTLTSQSTQVVIKEKSAIKKGAISTQPATYQMVVKGKELVQYGMPSFPLTLAANKALKDKLHSRGVPWKSLEELPNYLTLGTMLWDINKMKLLKPNWMRGPVAPVAGQQKQFLAMDNQYTLTIKPFGAFNQDLSLHISGEKSFVRPLSNLTGAAWISSDYKRFVQLKEGDVWSGQVSWKYNTYKNLTNKTNIGLLNNAKLISWYKDTIYVKRENGGDNPISRININTGKLDELKGNPAFNGSHGSPDGRFVFASYTGTSLLHKLHIYDAAKHEFFKMPSSYNMRRYGGELEEDEEPVNIEPRSWLNEYTFLTSYGWYDLKARKRLQFSDFPQIVKDLPARIWLISLNHLPDADYVDAILSGHRLSPTGQGFGPKSEARYLINIKTKVTKKLPLAHAKNEHVMRVTWLDTERYVYSVYKGGLNDVGVWLYNINSKKTKRLSSFVHDSTSRMGKNSVFKPAQYTRFRIPAYESENYKIIPKRNEIVFCSTRGNKKELIVVSYETGKQRKAEVKGKISGCPLSQILPHEIVIN